jgi:hypothetical protein
MMRPICRGAKRKHGLFALATPDAAVKVLVDSARAKTPGFGNWTLGKDARRCSDQATLTRTPRTEAVRRGSGRVDHDRRWTQWREDPPSWGWPLPLPLIKTDAGWRFDVAKGKEEMTNRRVGCSELIAIEARKA